MERTTKQLEFLDLDQIDSTEAESLQSLLYSVNSGSLQLPWTEDQEQFSTPSWTEQTYDANEEVYDGGGESGQEPAGNYHLPVVSVVTTPQQPIFHQVLPPPLAYVHPSPNPPYTTYGPPQPQHITPFHPPVYPDRRARHPKSSPKRMREYQQVSPSGPLPPNPQYTASMPTPFHMASYQYITPSPPQHIPTAQHATGHPLYMTSIQPVYSPQIYNYPPIYPHIQQPPQPPHIPVMPNPIEEVKPEIKKDIKEPTPPKPASPKPEVKEAPPLENVFKVTSLPSKLSLPKKKDDPPPVIAPAPAVVPVSAPAQEVPVGKISWAARVKGSEQNNQPLKQKAPPQSSVATTPLRTDVKAFPNQVQKQEIQSKNEDKDPNLCKLGVVLSQYQLDHKPAILTPRGLANPGNYCYINATLQALLACPAFYNLVKAISDLKGAAQNFPSLCDKTQPVSKTPIIDSMIQFVKEFSLAPTSRFSKRDKAQMRKEKDKDDSILEIVGTPFEPTYVYRMLRTVRGENSFHEEGIQEDAEEFLSLLLNGLNDEMLELQQLVKEPKKPLMNGDRATNGDAHDDESLWKEVTTKGNRVTRRAELERTPLSDIFRGQLRSRVQRAEESTDNVQPFFTLQLDIESSETVNQALEKLVGQYEVEGSSPSLETACQVQQSLDQLPCVLILHLKCFHYRQQTPIKICKALQFPVDLKLDQKLLSKNTHQKARQYKLFAVVYHDGKEATKGHYLADVFHVGACTWVRYDDAIVKTIQENTVLQPKQPRVPYLLYYRRADTMGNK